MLGGIYFIEKYIMNVVSSFYLGSEEDMENKQKMVIHDTTKLHPRDQERMYIVDKSRKGRQVTFEDDKVETRSEEYVVVTENDIGTEKSRKRPKVIIPKNKSVSVNDENVMRKKSKVEHFEVVITNNQEPRKTS